MNLEKSICVVGCGVTGLSALRVFSEEINGIKRNYSIFGYEKRSKLGGLWNYSDEVTGEFVSPMYRDIKTNLPKELMVYPDLSYPSDIKESFIHHTHVLKYMQDYVKHYDLEKFIHYNSDVVHIEPVRTGDSVKWTVKIKNAESIVEKHFDIVLICNGHYEKPSIPLIDGINNFKGECIHSKYYRIPEKYSNKTVVVVGAKASGIDITLLLLDQAKKVYLSHAGVPCLSKLNGDNFKEIGLISHIDSQGKIWSADGSQYEADAIILCTGFEINLNFLDDSIGLKFDNTYVRPLYKNFIHPFFPTSFFFIGLGYEFIPFVHSYLQCKVIRAIVENCHRNIELSTEKMMKEIKAEEEKFETDKTAMRHRHRLNEKEWPFLEWCEDVAQNIMTAEIPRYSKNMFYLVAKWRGKSAAHYREISMKIVDNNKLGFIITEGPDEDFYSEDYKNLL